MSSLSADPRSSRGFRVKPVSGMVTMQRSPTRTVTAPPTASTARLVKRRTPYADYAAFYLVRFAAFNPDGTARINRDTKTVTLRVLNGDEARYAAFDLGKLP